MKRKTKSAHDFITRAECQALVVHTLNQLFAEFQKPDEPTVEQMADEALAEHRRGETLPLGALPCS